MKKAKSEYCLVCMRAFGVRIDPHISRSYSITPLGRIVLARLRRQGRIS